jgi:hypothetical protein
VCNFYSLTEYYLSDGIKVNEVGRLCSMHE